MVGKWLISLEREAKLELRAHQLGNPSFRRLRYPFYVRLLRAGLHGNGLPIAFAAYLLVIFAITLASDYNDALCRVRTCQLLLPAELTATTDMIVFLRDVAGFMIGAQTGLLGVLSIAVALVTLIGQREHASSDVRVYYYQSFAAPLAASSLTLLAVLCTQLFWPLSLFSPFFGSKGNNLTSEFFITTINLTWLIFNIGVYAHFVLSSLSFGQDHQRNAFRELYAANVLVPAAISGSIIRRNWASSPERITNRSAYRADFRIGRSHFEPQSTSVSVTFRSPNKLRDVRIIFLRLAFSLWARRVQVSEDRIPTLYIDVDFDRRLSGEHELCLTENGHELSVVEAALVKLAFRFRRCR